jgi:hypothetical protein
MSVVVKGIVSSQTANVVISSPSAPPQRRSQQMENEEAADTEIVLYIDRSEQSWRRILKLDVANLIQSI